MKYFNLFFILCYMLTTCWFNIGTVEAIIGGRPALYGEFSHMIGILADDKYVCGGVIIGEHVALTAASCVIDDKRLFKDKEFSILMGSNNLIGESTPKITMDVVEIYVPREYERAPTRPNTHYYYEIGDIAILKLEDGLGLRATTFVTKAKLPTRSVINKFPRYDNQKATVVGFGVDVTNINIRRDKDNNEIFNKYCSKLKAAETVVVDTATCASMYPMIPIVEKHLCAKVQQHNPKYPEGVCHGDIGSPLFTSDKTLIGILVQNRADCNEQTKAAIYTRISSYIPFINKASKEAKNQIDSTISGVRVAAYKTSSNSVGSSSGKRHLREITK